MYAKLLAEKIELYSNAIVGFSVLQSLSYCYALGSNPRFNCVIKTASHLAEVLTAMFLLVVVLSVIGTAYLSKVLVSLSGKYSPIVVRIYRAKMVVIILFGSLPAWTTYYYNVLDNNGRQDCKVQLADPSK